jgi:hypothetical protein
MPSFPLEALQLKRDQIKAQLAQVGDMRPGSLVERYRRCGKRSCHCAQKDARGHGPSYSLTHPVGGKTVTRIIPKGAAVEQTRVQIAEYRRFRELVRQLVGVSEQICDTQLQQAGGIEAPDDKKNCTRRALGRRGRQRS